MSSLQLPAWRGHCVGGRACGLAASGGHSRWASGVSGDLTAFLCLMWATRLNVLGAGIFSVCFKLTNKMISDALGEFGFLSPLFNVFTGFVDTADVTVNSCLMPENFK